MRDEFDFEEEEHKGRRLDILGMLVRRRWYLIAPLFLCGFLGAVVAKVWRLPYISEALILVEQQKVPEQYVTPNVISDLQHRLDAMTQQILSRTRLQRLIEDFKLYPRQRARVPIDDVIDGMRKDVKVELVQTPGRQGDLVGFRIHYSAEDPRVAQRITNELTSLFIDESLRQRTQQSASTTQFLENQLEASRKDLEQQEQRLREYKLRYLGELPQQEQGNLQVLSSLEAQLYTATAALERAEQQKTYLESTKAQYMTLLEAISRPDNPANPDRPGTSPAVRRADEILLQLEGQLAEARTRLTPQNPTVQALEQQIEAWKDLRKRALAEAQAAKEAEAQAAKENVAKENAATNAANSVRTPGTADTNLIEVESRLKATVIEIGSRQKDVEELRSRIQDVQKHLNLTPVREQQLADITRTSENSRANYQSLLQKKLQSELASNLEQRQQGEQFRILDPASLPERAEGRLKILGVGWFLGLCLGVGLAVLREFSSNSVYDEADVKLLTPIPIFTIATIRSSKEKSRRKWRYVMEAVTVCMLVLASVGASLRTYLLS